MREGIKWQMTVRKVKLLALRLGMHKAILASSPEAERQVLQRATTPFTGETPAEKIKIHEAILEAIAVNGFECSKEDACGVAMPVLLALIEDNPTLGTFYWRRSALKDRQGMRTDAVIHH